MSQNIVKTENIQPSVHHLKVKFNWVVQEDNYPKHRIQITSEWLKIISFEVLKLPRESPDLIHWKGCDKDLKTFYHCAF